jgi:hypothetical protein
LSRDAVGMTSSSPDPSPARVRETGRAPSSGTSGGIRMPLQNRSISSSQAFSIGRPTVTWSQWPYRSVRSLTGPSPTAANRGRTARWGEGPGWFRGRKRGHRPGNTCGSPNRFVRDGAGEWETAAASARVRCVRRSRRATVMQQTPRRATRPILADGTAAASPDFRQCRKSSKAIRRASMKHQVAGPCHGRRPKPALPCHCRARIDNLHSSLLGQRHSSESSAENRRSTRCSRSQGLARGGTARCGRNEEG